MRKLFFQLLTRFAAAASACAVASSATLVWQSLPARRLPPNSSAEVFAGLTQASVEAPMWPEQVKDASAHYWIFRRGLDQPTHDINHPVAINQPDDNLLTFGCLTLFVSVDEARQLRLNLDPAGSLDDPAALGVKLTSLFGELEANRAYKPGMEYRTELPTHERIDRTVIINAPTSLRYGEILELVNFLERTGANPLVLHTGDSSAYRWEAVQE